MQCFHQQTQRGNELQLLLQMISTGLKQHGTSGLFMVQKHSAVRGTLRVLAALAPTLRKWQEK